MKIFIFAILFIISFPSFASAQCKAEPQPEQTGKVLANKKFIVQDDDKSYFVSETNISTKSENEMYLSLKASAKDSSWNKNGAEAAVLTIFVDGVYNQDVALFAGEEKFDYRVSLGSFPKGEHTLSIVLNEARSARNAKKVRIYSTKISPISTQTLKDKDDAKNFAALVNAPIIYARPNAIDKFTDIPLVTYYEILPEAEEKAFKIRYTTIFSHEDGGTQAAALMARWGRITDIEWVYELKFKDSKIVSETYQGANHETKNFYGKRVLGSHPLIFTVTDNNNFSDKGCSALRFAPLPVQADLSKKSRETLMDENAWTYRIMAQEAEREGRVNPQQLGVNSIDDLRNYLYVEVYAENNSTAMAIEARTKDGKTSRSDFGDERLRVGRSGYQRIAVRLPSNSSPLESLTLLCQSVSGSRDSGICQNTRIVKFTRLDKNFRPVETLNSEIKSRSLKPEERLIWLMSEK